MSAAHVVAPGAGEVIGDAPDRRVEILAEHPALHATCSRFGPGRDGADLHVHRRHSDLFYVLEGELTVRLGIEDEPVRVRAGTLARVPPLVVHGFRNASDGQLRYLNLHAPGEDFANYMRALRDGREYTYDQEEPPADGGRPVAEAAVGEGELLADADGLRVALLTDVDAIGVAEIRSDASAPAHPQLHRDHAESLYVLEGELALTAGDRELHAPAGAWVQIPPGVPHALAWSAPVRFLDVHAPSAGFGSYLRARYRDRHDAAAAVARTGFDRHPAR